LEVILKVEAGTRRRTVVSHPVPAPVGAQHPGIGLIEQGGVEDVDEALLDDGVLDGYHHLHPAVEVSLHEVG
jgi:hypothetical protein